MRFWLRYEQRLWSGSHVYIFYIFSDTFCDLTYHHYAHRRWGLCRHCAHTFPSWFIGRPPYTRAHHWAYKRTLPNNNVPYLISIDTYTIRAAAVAAAVDVVWELFFSLWQHVSSTAVIVFPPPQTANTFIHSAIVFSFLFSSIFIGPMPWDLIWTKIYA